MKQLFALCLALLPSLAYASPRSVQPQEEAIASSAITDEVINKLCPIGVEPVDGKIFATYDGHKLGFCCAGCDSKFLAWSKEKKDAFVQTALAGQESSETEKKPGDGKAEERASEPYTLSTCPVSGEKLGSMGNPVVLTVEGREVRLCCKGCVGKIEKDAAKYLKIVDQGLVAQQKPYYPAATCVVSGEPLVEEGKDIGLEVIVKNRLFRLCCKGCVKKLKENPSTYFADLDERVKEDQRDDYPIETCLVSGEKLGSMGDPVEVVVGNRLVRLCCSGCQPKFGKDPTTFISRLDAAWAPVHAKRAEAKPDKKDTHGSKDGHVHDKDGGR